MVGDAALEEAAEGRVAGRSRGHDHVDSVLLQLDDTSGLPSRVGCHFSRSWIPKNSRSRPATTRAAPTTAVRLASRLVTGRGLRTRQAEREHPSPTSIPGVRTLERLAWGDRAPRSDDEDVQPDENQHHTVGGVQGSQPRARSGGQASIPVAGVTTTLTMCYYAFPGSEPSSLVKRRRPLRHLRNASQLIPASVRAATPAAREAIV